MRDLLARRAPALALGGLVLLGSAIAMRAAPVLPPAAVPPQPATGRSTLSEANAARADAILAQPFVRVVTTCATDCGAPASGAATMTEPDCAPPTDLLAGSRMGLPAPRAIGWQADFILDVASAARRDDGLRQVPPSVTIAQAILESDWGRSSLARRARNYFGIKAAERGGSAGMILLPTTELGPGGAYQELAPFRAYLSLDDSVADHTRFLRENSRYRQALTQGADAEAFARALQRAGYATDPNYAAKLLGLMDQYSLYWYDG